jgi:isopenicillin-N epimerase
MHRELREAFHLDTQVAFLNHGSFGACPKSVLDTRDALAREMEREPVDFLVRRAPGLFRQARKRLADFAGCTAADFVFIPNATSGVNLVLRSLPLKAGDEILSCDHEYGACDRAWEAEARRRDLKLKKIELELPLPADDELVERFRKAIGPSTRVLYFSHITSPTAQLLPMEKLAALGREHGLFVFVDGAHGPGQVPLVLEESGVDAYAGNAHKWLMGPKGTGFLYLRSEHHKWIEPLVISWGSTQHDGESRLVQELEWPGTRDPSSFLALEAALDFRRITDWDQRSLEKRRELSDWLHQLCDKRGWQPLVQSDHSLQMMAFEVPALDEAGLHSALYHEFNVEVPVIAFRNRSLVRVSYQPYNGLHELEMLEQALDKLLPADELNHRFIKESNRQDSR